MLYVFNTGKPLLMLKAIKGGYNLHTRDPRFHVCMVKFLIYGKPCGDTVVCLCNPTMLLLGSIVIYIHLYICTNFFLLIEHTTLRQSEDDSYYILKYFHAA